MLNKYPLWKNLFLLFVVIFSFIYSAPNFYPPDPAVQISKDDGAVDQAALDVALKALDDDGLEYTNAAIDNNGQALIRLTDANSQSRAQQLINLELPQDYIVALNLAPNTPKWLENLGAGPMAYGLDLQGGVHFLMEVDMEKAVDKQLNDTVSAIRNQLREERIRYRPPVTVDSEKRIVIRFNDEQTRSAALEVIRPEFPDLLSRTADNGQEYLLYFNIPEAGIVQLQAYAVQQNLTTLRSRVNELGVKEPKIQQMGPNRIIIELPGIQDTVRAKDLISAVATLQFHLVASPSAQAGSTIEYDYEGAPIKLDENIIVGGERVTGAQTSIDSQTTMPQVNITLDAVGARQINEVTRTNIGNQMAILLSETKTRNVTEQGPNGELVTKSVPFVEEKLISVATIQSALGRQFRITGLQADEANDLALLIRSGALAAPMYFLEESTVGPSLGQENIDNGLKSVLIGFGALVFFMIVYYRVSGAAAIIALFCNLLLLVTIMSVVGWTLTMPGIAGIVLTLGMAVDANVLIFARIKDEILDGMSIPRAINAGYEKAFVTILDANITTLIVSVILFSIGSGPVKGFAITLTLGILTSMFTSIMISRAIINLLYGGNNVKSISMGFKLPNQGSAVTL